MKGPSLVSLGVEVIYLGWELFKIKSIVDEHNENKEVVMKNDNGKEIIAINIPKSHFQLKCTPIVRHSLTIGGAFFIAKFSSKEKIQAVKRYLDG
uniref:hypothetical protein n=1 Tax=Bacillus cereus group sp. BfR-BA-01524 TaxID=2920372 RepID=UPI001F58B7B6